MSLSPYTYSPRQPSLAKILLALFIFSTLIVYAAKEYIDNRPSKLEERLWKLGYPKEGFIAYKENSTLILKYAGGLLVAKTGQHLEFYNVTAEEAYTLARQHFAPINQKLKEANIDIQFFVKPETLTEKEKKTGWYWCFEVWQEVQGTKLNTYNLVCVNRKTGSIVVESPFEAISLG
ncbi:hypothetical protein [Thermococcus barophilus]|uniref:Uncharacterized protein n=1 Tax=Thermococcus barophilus TaxID=55802 RepID=A0A0S1XAM9_THEBA|nr:hypothetical protein [Thermococcus barophilus]ALM74842.1 conserved exported hypothetical protein [Thermococcus barophilus]